MNSVCSCAASAPRRESRSRTSSDARSRSIVEQMQRDEARHGEDAQVAGARPLPALIRGVMRNTARVMTRTAYRW